MRCLSVPRGDEGGGIERGVVSERPGRKLAGPRNRQTKTWRV